MAKVSVDQILPTVPCNAVNWESDSGSDAGTGRRLQYQEFHRRAGVRSATVPQRNRPVFRRAISSPISTAKHENCRQLRNETGLRRVGEEVKSLYCVKVTKNARRKIGGQAMSRGETTQAVKIHKFPEGANLRNAR